MNLTQEQKESLFNIYMKFDGGEVQAMQALIDAYEEMRPQDNEWISVKERLPTADDAYCDRVTWWGASDQGIDLTWNNNEGPEHYTHWKRIIPPVITPPTLEEVERPKFEEWMKENFHQFGAWEAWLARAKSEQSAKA